MNPEVQQKVERVLESQMKKSKFARQAKERGLNALYVANQLSALVGELCEASDEGEPLWIDRHYVAEKLQNVQRQIDNILG